ncbi:MAG: peptide chain release factor 3 [Kiritimatiellae bacterium]|nr:peptide chain release factor 3 [Kiritimatiellia bacterium]
MSNEHEIARRRTFAIISHPDAGKTTLTEKFLLYGGAVQLAGSVTARKTQSATTSDWMELEKQRGISVSSTVLQFEYRGYCINLLDTPGHRDFSEDTYRVLMAVDAVVMVIDAAKGIESQTLKLFEMCRLRGIPIFTFVNKFDRPARDPLAIIDELEQTLQLHVCAMNWPLGDGLEFRGVFDRMRSQAHFFERTPGGSYRAPVSVHDVTDPQVRKRLSEQTYANLTEHLAMLDAASEPLDRELVRTGDMTPVFFGSAINNFGVHLLLDAFLEYAPPPHPRRSNKGLVKPQHPLFSGFIFKIQSNMDPKHRDQIAFLRVCSGTFTRDMKVFHPRTGKTLRLASSQRVFGRERETVDEAFPGDVIGLVGHGAFGIGDTLAEDEGLTFEPLPQFPPECFALLHNPVSSTYKRFRTGLEHLLQEGAVQAFALKDSVQNVPLLGAVGVLQFDVLQYRLESEYGATSRLEPMPWKIIRWIASEDVAHEALRDGKLPIGCRLAEDSAGRTVALFNTEWELKYFCDKNPGLHLAKLPAAPSRETTPAVALP